MSEVIVIPALGDNYIYLLTLGTEAIAFDPAVSSPVLRILKERNIRLRTIFNTHCHFDHVGGNEELKQKSACTVIGPDKERTPAIDRVARDGDIIPVGPLAVHVIGTPGHTESDLSYYIPASEAHPVGMVWTGDTLFIGGCGRLFGGSAEVMWSSLGRLMALPTETAVYCAHEYTVENYEFAAMIEPDNKAVRDRLEEVQALIRVGKPTVPSTVGREKATNPFVRAATPMMKKALHMADKSDAAVFRELRRRKDIF